MLKTVKDTIFWVAITIWLLLDLIALLTNHEMYGYIINVIFIVIFVILNILKFNSEKFNNWLKKPLNKD